MKKPPGEGRLDGSGYFAGLRYIWGMSIAGIFLSVVMANALCGSFVYAAWRLNRDENDKAAMAIAAFCLLVIGIIAVIFAQAH